MTGKSKIAMLLPDLRSGGAEVVSLALARYWVSEGYPVDLVVLSGTGELAADIGPGIRVITLNAPRIRKAIAPLRRYFQAEAPEVMLASMWPLTVAAVLALKMSKSKSRLVLSDHTLLGEAYCDRGLLHRALMKWSLRWICPTADAHLAVSTAVARDLSRLSNRPLSTYTVIYNPVVEPKPLPLDLSSSGILERGQKVILSVGRLKAAKNYTLLIHAFLLLSGRTEAVLCIVGDGEQRKSLEALVNAQGISDRVIFAGYCQSPAAYYEAADVLVVSSDYEGFSNVVVEALAHGLAVVSTKCGGPEEILDDGRYGFMVPRRNVAVLAETIEKALVNPPAPALLKERARDFSLETIGRQYLEVMFKESSVSPKQ